MRQDEPLLDWLDCPVGRFNLAVSLHRLRLGRSQAAFEMIRRCSHDPSIFERFSFLNLLESRIRDPWLPGRATFAFTKILWHVFETFLLLSRTHRRSSPQFSFSTNPRHPNRIASYLCFLRKQSIGTAKMDLWIVSNGSIVFAGTSKLEVDWTAISSQQRLRTNRPERPLLRN